jgi:hypothetical protein
MFLLNACCLRVVHFDNAMLHRRMYKFLESKEDMQMARSDYLFQL